jgi:hypothetical protein
MGVPEMTQLAATAKVTPAVNQIELHPWLQNKHVTDYCNEHGIVLEVSNRDSSGPCWCYVAMPSSHCCQVHCPAMHS